MEDLSQLLLGRFAGIDELHASPWSSAESATVEMDSTAELGGSLIVMRVTETRSAATFEAINVFMPDPATGEVLLYGFDSVGYAPDPPARGRYADSRIVLNRRTDRGESRTVFAGEPDGLSWSKQFRPSAEAPWQAVVTGTLRRLAAGT